MFHLCDEWNIMAPQKKIFELEIQGQSQFYLFQKFQDLTLTKYSLNI